MSSSLLSDKEKTEKMALLKEQRTKTMHQQIRSDLRLVVLNYLTNQQSLDVAIDKSLHVDRTELLITALHEIADELEKHRR
jgi:predicted DNA-binding ribbon-helix-helix protein